MEFSRKGAKENPSGSEDLPLRLCVRKFLLAPTLNLMTPVIMSIASVIPVPLDQVSRARTRAGSNDGAFASADQRTTN